jgi:hypothetical protein
MMVNSGQWTAQAVAGSFTGLSSGTVWYFPGGIVEDYEDSLNIRWPNQDSNRIPPDNKS